MKLFPGTLNVQLDKPYTAQEDHSVGRRRIWRQRFGEHRFLHNTREERVYSPHRCQRVRPRTSSQNDHRDSDRLEDGKCWLLVAPRGPAGTIATRHSAPKVSPICELMPREFCERPSRNLKLNTSGRVENVPERWPQLFTTSVELRFFEVKGSRDPARPPAPNRRLPRYSFRMPASAAQTPRKLQGGYKFLSVRVV
jgi:hypothetical protein